MGVTHDLGNHLVYFFVDVHRSFISQAFTRGVTPYTREPLEIARNLLLWCYVVVVWRRYIADKKMPEGLDSGKIKGRI